MPPVHAPSTAGAGAAAGVRLLVLNPNTSPSVSALLRQQALAALPSAPGLALEVATAPFGAEYITGEVSAAVAGHAALQAWAEHVAEAGVPHAVLLACFGDPGLFALRALAPVPVLGLAESTMAAVAQAHGPFVIVTGGAGWAPMLHRLAAGLPLAAPLLGVQTLERSGGELAAQPAQAPQWLAQACEAALQRWPQARAVLLGGAGLAGMAGAVATAWAAARRDPPPVLGSVELALPLAWSAARDTAMPDGATAQAAADPTVAAAGGATPPHEQALWSGLAPPLRRLLPGWPGGLRP